MLLGFGSTVLVTESCSTSRTQKSRGSQTGSKADSVPASDDMVPIRVLYGVAPARFDPDKPIRERSEKITVGGRIINNEGAPIIGATVLNKNRPASGAVSDEDGRYSIEVDRGDSLVFMFIGMIPQSVAVGESGDALDVRMEIASDSARRDFVVAYGTQVVRFDPEKNVRERVTVSGRVTGETGEPIRYVTVSIRGGSVGVVTDEDGRYSIEADRGDSLVFQHVGMVSQTLEVTKRKRLDVVLTGEE